MEKDHFFLFFCLLLTSMAFMGCRRSKEIVTTVQSIKTKTGIEMVTIPGGWFEMGNERGASDEKPVHRVWISPFFMDRFEVIQSQFRKYQISDPSHFKDPNNPLERMNWTDAAIYCNERSLAEGMEPCYDEQTWQCSFKANGYRLPTEAEWEYACRAGAGTRYSFGNNAQRLADYAWFAENSGGKTHPIGRKKPNPWGLYDMHGNVAEWCNDFYSADYYKNSPERDPKGPQTGTEKVLRGGAWNSSADSCRSTYRASDPSINDTCLASDAIGFRCVRNVSGDLYANDNPGQEPPVKLGANYLYNYLAPRFTWGFSFYGLSGGTPAKTGLVYDDIYLEHKTTPDHPETPQRLTAIMDKIRAEKLDTKLIMLSPKPAQQQWITMVHSPQYVEHVKKSCASCAAYLDSPDTPISEKSCEAALVAAGGVMCAIDAVMDGRVKNCFCAVRPPGHHALPDRAMGFCIFNNVAIGARYLQKKYNLGRILIVDWDVHHGNSTQQVFYDDPSVMYFSVHQYPFYPGSGSAMEKGSGKGLGYNINVPLPAGATDADYVKAFEEKLTPAAIAFKADFVLISAGFDAHESDPLGGMRVTTEGFAQLTRIVKQIAQKCCRGRLVSVLEGGYNLEGLAESVQAHICALME